jgi:polar amino acid transport system substrate-binding protein
MTIRFSTVATTTCLMLAALPVVAGAAELPARIRAAGVINIAVNAIYPPMEYKDPASGKLIGLDIDLGEAMAAKLGVKLNWEESAFEQLMPSLQTGRADMVLSGLSDLPARHEVADFIDYMKTGGHFYVLAASPYQDAEALCGHKVGTSRSTAFPAAIKDWSAANCEAKGKPAIEVVPAESTADARGQLRQGRIDAAVQGYETLPYVMSLEPNTYRPVGEPVSLQYQGIAFPKADTALRDAVAGAFKAILDDGTYAKVMAKWQLSANSVNGLMMNGQPWP